MASERWSGRTIFVLAAVGSAVGLGNLWRFPYIVYDNGGAVFLIPWLVAIFTAGFPLLVLEMAVGCWGRSKFDVKGAPAAFGAMRPGMRWIGWGALANGFIIVCFYAVVMGWAFNYLVKSFTLGWGSDAQGHFFNQVLQISSGPGDINKLVPALLMGAIVAWICVYLAIFKGTRIVAKIVTWTVPLPVLIIIVFLIRGLTLPGAFDGLAFYLKPEWGKLLEPKVWLAAYAQVFFSMTLAFGVMPAYASYLPKNSDISANALWVTILNASVSFISGFAVFTILGFLALQKGVAVSEVVSSGPGLAFVTYPTAISLMPVFAKVFGVLFFITLLTLAIDSAFSLVEGIVAGIRDYLPFKRETITFAICSIALAGGVLFCTDAGLYWLDIVDHHINNFGLTAFGLFECIAIGWIFGAERIRKFVNSTSDFSIGRWWNFCIKYLTPAVLIFIIVTTLIQRIRVPYEGYPQWALLVGGWGAVALAFLIAFGLSRIFRTSHKAVEATEE
jgi:NSS family neurotransmitter:Na+ symporter